MSACFSPGNLLGMIKERLTFFDAYCTQINHNEAGRFAILNHFDSAGHGDSAPAALELS